MKTVLDRGKWRSLTLCIADFAVNAFLILMKNGGKSENSQKSNSHILVNNCLDFKWEAILSEKVLGYNQRKIIVLTLHIFFSESCKSFQCINRYRGIKIFPFKINLLFICNYFLILWNFNYTYFFFVYTYLGKWNWIVCSSSWSGTIYWYFSSV